MPKAARAGASVLVPSVDPIAPADRGAEIMCALFACRKEDLSNGEGWGDASIRLSSQLGTHVDAPLHCGSTCEGRPARTISEIALEELDCDGVVLDLRQSVQPGQGIPVEALQRAIDANRELAADRSAWEGAARDRSQPGESRGALQVGADR